MRAAELMTTKVQTATPNMPAADAWDLMRRQGIHHLVVVSGSEIAGIVSERDAGGRYGATIRKGLRVADLMTKSVTTVDPDATIRKIANVMRGRTIGCLPVVDGKRLAGIVTVTDLLEALGRGIDRPVPAKRSNLHHRVPHRKQASASGMW